MKCPHITYNTCYISWDSYDIFCNPNVGLCQLASQKTEIQHWEGRNTTFCWIMGVARGLSQLKLCDKDCGSVQLTVFGSIFWLKFS